MSQYKLSAPILLLGLSACATVAPTASRDAFNEVAGRLHQYVPQGDSLKSAVAQMLARPLTAETAAAVALLNNPDLAGDFAGIGIAQADWVQAGILRNPVLALGLEIPTTPPSATRLQVSFTESFLQLVTLPRRRRIAEQDFLAVRARICARAVALACDAKARVFSLQAQREYLRRSQAILDLEEAAFELARQQHVAGNIADFDLARRREALAERRLECDAAAAADDLAAIQLARLLGTAEPISVAPELPPLPEKDLPSGLEQLAVAQRWEVAAAQAEVRGRARALGLTKDYAWADSLDLGAQFERDVTNQKTVGPALGLPLPLFDRGDARATRAAAELQQAEARLRAAELQARLDVREEQGHLRAALTMAVRCREELLPARRDLVRLVNERYNGMYAGPYDLIAARQSELTAEQQDIFARRDAWLAWAHLECAAGGNLDLPSSHDAHP